MFRKMSDFLFQISITFLLLFGINCIQTAYKFIHEHCEVPFVNETLATLPVKMCYKPNRTGLALNITIQYHVDIPSDNVGQVEIVGYQFRSNEYRKGPIEALLGICAFIETKDFDMPHMLSDSNFSTCPIQKDQTYYVKNLIPDAINFPPGIPDGRWMLELKFMYQAKYCIFSVRWFAKVEYIFVY